MTVYFNKNRKRWCYDFEHRRKRFAGYAQELDGSPCASRRAAAAAEARERERAVIAPKLPRAGDYTLAQAFAELTPAWSRLDDYENKKRYIRELVRFFGEDTAIAAIGPAEVEAYTEFARTQPLRIWTGGPSRPAGEAKNAHFWKTSEKRRSPRTVNLYLKTLDQALTRAASVRDPITGASAIKMRPAVAKLAVPKRKARPVPEAVLSEVLNSVPGHIADAIVLTLYFGFRRGEVFTLQIHQADFDNGGVRLEAGAVKDDEDAFIPGAPAAMAFLQRLVDQARTRKTANLITWRRSYKDAARQAAEPWAPILSPKRAWSTVMDAIEGKFGRRWRWHDLRASFITHVAMTSGAAAAQKMARHSRYATTEAYVEVADEERRIAAARTAERPALRLIRDKQP
jgi:integrase